MSRYLRRVAAFAAVVLACVAAPGCARSVDGTPVSPSDAATAFPPSLPTQKSPPPPRSTYYDITRLSQLEGQFPPGFDRVQNTTIATLGPDADKFFAVGVGDIVKIDPPLCRSVLQPVRPPQDAQYTMIGGLGQGAILVGAVSSPKSLGKAVVPKGCEQVAVTQRVQGRLVVSNVTRQPGPPIDGVVTTESIATTAEGTAKSFVFSAFLSETVAVTAEGILPGNPDAEDLLSGMLVKAVNIIRAA
ncbi:DUF5642 family protein [Mycobacterium sp.]|uniref:DUF5642 family protein n=1 Tax=Mycobacterium sp. TaxID=1785 RepID=UPI0025E93939|nr:DUF5642 family protein [Mycobacterium sp.]